MNRLLTFSSVLLIMNISSAGVALAVSPTIDCSKRMPPAKSGWGAISDCERLASGDLLEQFAIEGVSQTAEELIQILDPQKSAPQTLRLEQAIQTELTLVTQYRALSQDFRSKLASDFSRLRRALRYNAGWNSCPASVWRECTVIALSVDDQTGSRSMDYKEPVAFQVRPQDELALLTTFLGTVSDSKIGTVDLDSIRGRLATYQAQSTQLEGLDQEITPLRKSLVAPAAKEFLEALLLPARP